MLEALRQDQPLLLGYRTPPSGGKTATAALLGALLHREWEGKTAGGPRRRFVLYTCFSNPVRIDVARTLIAASVPFAIVTGCVASPSYRCYFGRRPRNARPPPPKAAERVNYSVNLCEACDRRPVVLVCDPASALEFALRRPQDVLVLDEPMAGTERSGASPVLDANCRLLFHAPRVLLLASATLPALHELQPLLERLQARHQEMPRARFVNSSRLPINFTARDFSGKLWAPHSVVERREWPALAAALETSEHRHLQRFYAPAALLEIVDAAAPATEDLLCHEGLRRLALQGLRCASHAAIPADDEHSRYAAPEAGKLCCTHAHRWSGTSLIVREPSQYLEQDLAPLLQHVPVLRRLLRAQHQRGEQRQRRAALACQDEDGRVDHRANAEDASEEDGGGGSTAWPGWAVINSQQHFRRFAPEGAAALPPQALRTHYPVPAGVLEGSQTRLVEALCAGTAMLSTPGGDRLFEASALAAADSRRLSHVVADATILFGTNLAIDRVALCSDVDLDAAGLQQLCGRVGRTGKGLSAQVVLPESLVERAVRLRDDGTASLQRFWAAFQRVG